MFRLLVWTLMLLAIPGFAFAAGGPFGLGIIAGEPTGLSGKFFVSEKNAIEGAVAWSLSEDNDLHIQVDYLYHWYDVISVKKGRLPLFAGVGGQVVFRENRDDKVGIRIPVGLTYLFDGAPFDTFVELVPVLELTPDTDFALQGAIGGRYYF